MKGIRTKDDNTSTNVGVSESEEEKPTTTTTTTTTTTMESGDEMEQGVGVGVGGAAMMVCAKVGDEDRDRDEDQDVVGRMVMVKSTSVSIVIDTVEENTFFGKSDVEIEQSAEEEEHSLEFPQTEKELEDMDGDIENKVQSMLDYVKTRRNEFAKLLQEHAEIVHEINKFEGGVTS